MWLDSHLIRREAPCVGWGLPWQVGGVGPTCANWKSWAGLSINLIVIHTATTHDSPVVDVILIIQTNYHDSPAIDSHCYPAKHGLSSPTDIIYVIGLCYRFIQCMLSVYVIEFSLFMLSVFLLVCYRFFVSMLLVFFRITNIEFQVQNIDSQL